MLSRLLSALLVLWFAGQGVRSAIAAAEQEITNPFANNPEAIQTGRSRFRKECAVCHGIDARGGSRGPDLTSGFPIHGNSDLAIFRTIKQGVPGTDMPPGARQDPTIWMIISYLRSLGANSVSRIPGDPAAGERIFSERNCPLCHMVNGRGGRLGPDLSRIGAARAPHRLAEAIRDANKTIVPGYETVTVVSNDGQSITGLRKNEDTFSIQLMDQQERLHSYLKKDLSEVIPEPRSLMPSFGPTALDDKQLEDLVAYLSSLRGH